jgi:hypothetical protein
MGSYGRSCITGKPADHPISYSFGRKTGYARWDTRNSLHAPNFRIVGNSEVSRVGSLGWCQIANALNEGRIGPLQRLFST